MTFGTPFHNEKSRFATIDATNRPSAMAAEDGMLSGGFGSKLKCPTPISRLRVEKIEGGLMVAGVVIAANCQIALPAFGFLFMLVGAVLTAASYRGPGEDEDKDSYAARIAFTGSASYPWADMHHRWCTYACSRCTTLHVDETCEKKRTQSGLPLSFTWGFLPSQSCSEC